MIPFGIRMVNHLSLCVCVRASVFFSDELSVCDLLPSIILSIRRKNDLLFVYFVFDIFSRLPPLFCAHFNMIIETARDRVQLFDRVRYNCRNQIRMEEKTKGKQRREKKDQLTGN